MLKEYFINNVIFLSSVQVDLTVFGDISSKGILFDSIGNSLDWNSAYTTVLNESAFWINSGSGGSDISSLSANWDSVYTSVLNTSANWDSVYTTYNLNSASYATINLVNNKFLPLSGGLISGNINVLSSLDIGLSLEVGVGDTVLFVSGDKVGVNTETPNLELTVNGSISSNNEIYISNYKTVKTPITNNPGVSAVSTILVVSALPVSPISSILYIVV